MAQKVIGRDVSVYNFVLSGRDGTPASGQTTSMLGRWESIEITLTNEWATVTSSDATQPERRKKMQSWSASLKNWIDAGGSTATEAFLAADLVICVWTDATTGRTCTLRGGIMKASMTINADHGKDTLELEDVGSANFGGAQTFTYA